MGANRHWRTWWRLWVFACVVGTLLCPAIELTKKEVGERLVIGDSIPDYIQPGAESLEYSVAYGFLSGLIVGGMISCIAIALRFSDRANRMLSGLGVGAVAGYLSARMRIEGRMFFHFTSMDGTQDFFKFKPYEVHWRVVSEALDPIILGAVGGFIGIGVAIAWSMVTGYIVQTKNDLAPSEHQRYSNFGATD